MPSPLGRDDRVLVRLPSWLGDVVQAEPVVRALCAHVTPERVTLAAPDSLLPVLGHTHPACARAPHSGRGGERPAAWSGHDVALLLTGSFRSAWTALRAGIPRRVGWARDGRGFLLTDALTPARERGATPLGLGRSGRWPRFLPRPFGATCAELLGSVGVSVSGREPRLEVEPEARARVRARLGPRPYLVLNVGARRGSAKGYPSSAWARVADILAAETDLALVLVAGPGEEDATREVARAARAETLPLIDPVTTLSELAAVCADALVVLTADAGPRHVALAVGARVACVLGPTDPRHTAEWLGHQRVLRETVHCGPCHREVCPLSGAEEHRCMRLLDPERFASLALELLD